MAMPTSPFEPPGPLQRRSDVLVTSARGCCQELSICPSFGKVREKELRGNRAERWGNGHRGWTVGQLDGRTGRNRTREGSGGCVLKDELWLEGRCWSWSWKYGLANEICWSAKWESIVDTEEEQNSLLERPGWEKC